MQRKKNGQKDWKRANGLLLAVRKGRKNLTGVCLVGLILTDLLKAGAFHR
jgi:hypothetical protein